MHRAWYVTIFCDKPINIFVVVYEDFNVKNVGMSHSLTGRPSK